MKHLLVVGVLLLASASLLSAKPVDVWPANGLAPSCAAGSASRDGFLLPTLAVPAPGAGPRLIVTQNSMRGAVVGHLSRAAGQNQTPPKHQHGWFRRNWWWFVPAVTITTMYLVWPRG